MAKWQDHTYGSEEAGAAEKHTARTEKASEINRERSDKHHGGVERGVDPRCFVDAKVERAAKICEPDAEEPACTGRDHRAEKNAGNA
jgi:hypothetical protein